MGALLLAGMVGAAVYLVHREKAANKKKLEEESSKEMQKHAEKEERIKNMFTKEDAQRLVLKQNGNVTIPYGKTEICDNAFEMNDGLISVAVPSSVKTIGTRAFADCKNLKQVRLEEGLGIIGSNAFTGCESLSGLVIPDSAKEFYGWAFFRFNGLKKPVYSRSGDVLYCYPGGTGEKVFTVPAGVKRINSAAFVNDSDLEEIILPEGLEVISYRAFMQSGIRKITIPASVRSIGLETFFYCKSLERVELLGGNTSVEDGAFYGCDFALEIESGNGPRYDERLHWFGESFLYDACTALPGRRHLNDADFKRLAAECANGGAGAMWDFGNYFLTLGSHEFYTYAANYWRYRAALAGSDAAVKWLENWLRENPQKRMPAISAERSGVICGCMTVGNVSGKVMRYSGFMLFNENRDYTIKAPDENGIVIINSWCGDEGPDEDGFGREDFYDWWFADENLKQITGTQMIHSHSYRDTKYSAIYKEQYQKAADNIKSR